MSHTLKDGRITIKAEDILKGKKVLVTGASSGIGFQIAYDFLQAGATVGAHYRSNLQGVNNLLTSASHEQCKIFQADFSDKMQVIRVWKEFINWSSGIDILINNAGEAAVPVPLEELDDDSWDRTLNVNLKAPFWLSREALRIMSAQKSGRILNISSIGVKFGGGLNTIHYSASKAALEALTLSLAKAGAPDNVLVNAVRVGVTDTPMHGKIGRESDLPSRAALIPLGRIASPSEISQFVLFLAGEHGSYITGAVIPVSGGE